MAKVRLNDICFSSTAKAEIRTSHSSKGVDSFISTLINQALIYLWLESGYNTPLFGNQSPELLYV